MNTKRVRATPLSPDDRRKALVDAVLPLLAAQGATVTTKQIAEAAGVAEGTIFRVFPDKKALLFAAAQEAINPEGGGEAMAQAMAETPLLRDKVVLITGRMVERMEQGMLVMMAVRHTLMSEPHQHQHQLPPGPPEFLLESNRELLRRLTDLVFAPHADELAMAPDRAALLLRSLVFGTWHPGASGEARLSIDEIADACLYGVTGERS